MGWAYSQGGPSVEVIQYKWVICIEDLCTVMLSLFYCSFS